MRLDEVLNTIKNDEPINPEGPYDTVARTADDVHGKPVGYKRTGFGSTSYTISIEAAQATDWYKVRYLGGNLFLRV